MAEVVAVVQRAECDVTAAAARRGVGAVLGAVKGEVAEALRRAEERRLARARRNGDVRRELRRRVPVERLERVDVVVVVVQL